MNKLIIYDEKNNPIIVKSVEDLNLLPDKSVKVLINNFEYMAILYLYILHRVDAYLQTKKYPTKIRVEYFEMCLSNFPMLLEYQKEFLKNNNTDFIIKFKKLPKDLDKIYRNSVLAVCNFFRGMLATTSFWEKGLLPRTDKQLLRHNYGYMVFALLNFVE